jgi:cell division initiation protein
MDKFTITEQGYSIPEVNKFIDNVILQTESMLEKMKRQQVEVEKLRKEIENYKKEEISLKNELQRRENTSDEIKKQVYDEKNNIIDEARRNASRIVNDALLRAEKIELKTATLERNMRIFKKKLRSIMDQQMAVVEEIELLELEDK